MPAVFEALELGLHVPDVWGINVLGIQDRNRNRLLVGSVHPEPAWRHQSLSNGYNLKMRGTDITHKEYR